MHVKLRMYTRIQDNTRGVGTHTVEDNSNVWFKICHVIFLVILERGYLQYMYMYVLSDDED